MPLEQAIFGFLAVIVFICVLFILYKFIFDVYRGVK